MSSSDLYLIFFSKTRNIKSYKNGHGTGPMIWDYIWIFSKYEGFILEELCKEDHPFWKEVLNPEYPEAIRISTAFTYDRVFCPIPYLSRLSIALKEAHDTIVSDGAKWTHFECISKDVAELASSKIDKRCLGLALNCTSISDQWVDYKYRDSTEKPTSLFEVTNIEP